MDFIYYNLMKTPTTTSASSSDKSTADKKAAAVTPEEVKHNVAKKNGYINWLDLIMSVVSYKEIEKYENEAMRDYASACAKAAADEAEALYKDRIEKAGSELPSKEEIIVISQERHKHWYTEYEQGEKRRSFEHGANWMKEQASVVILKEMERTNDILTVLGDREKDIRTLQKNIKHLVEEIEQKDKEIVELKESNLKISSEWCNRSAELHKEIYELKTKLDYWIRCKECENRKPMQGSDTCESCALQNHVP